MKKRRRYTGLTPVERALIAQSWSQLAVKAQLHALIGNDSDGFVSSAGRVLYVTLGACRISGVPVDTPDVRIVMGACNALCEQAGEAEIDESRRLSLQSGLAACSRLLPRLTQRALVDAAIDLRARLAAGVVRQSDFAAAMEAVA